MEDVSKLSSAQISVLIDKKETELGLSLNAYYDVEQEKINLQRQILELQIKKKDIETTMSKGNQNISKMKVELKALRSFFWNAKQSGL